MGVIEDAAKQERERIIKLIREQAAHYRKCGSKERAEWAEFMAAMLDCM